MPDSDDAEYVAMLALGGIEYGWWPRPYAPIGGDVIYLPRPSIKWMLYRNQSYAALIRHEKGHLNGWPQDHPGMRRVDNYD